MKRTNIKEAVATLSPLELELWEFITTAGVTTTKELSNVNPKFLGALGKLKSKGLVIIERLPWFTFIWPIVDLMEE